MTKKQGEIVQLNDYRDGTTANKKLSLAQYREVALQVGELQVYRQLFERLLEKGECASAILVRTAGLQTVELQDFIARGILFLRRIDQSGPASAKEVRAYLLESQMLVDDSKKLFDDLLRSINEPRKGT